MAGTSVVARGGARVSDPRTNEEILQDLRRDVVAADEVATRALVQLDQQTEQIRRINDDVDHVSASMDQASKIIKGMSPVGMVRQALSGRKGQAQAGRSECKWMWRDLKVPSPFGSKSSTHNKLRWSHWQGFEDTIRDIDGHKEHRRILCKIALPGREEDEVEFENPRDAVDKIRDLLVLQQQAALAAIGGTGPGSLGSSSGMAPQAPPSAVPRVSAAAARHLPGQQEEAVLADVEGLLDGMTEKTRQMNRTLDVQNQMLPAVTEKMERERHRAEDHTKKLQKMQGR